MDFSLVLAAFIAGLITFLAPCTLPLIPGYLVFVSGTQLGDLEHPEKARLLRNRVVRNGIFFVLGFSIIFIFFGTIVAFVGTQALFPYRAFLSKAAGIFIIFFGLLMTGFLKWPYFLKEKRLKLPSFFDHGTALNSLLLGAAFAFGWTPCIGPILGSVLLLAGNVETVFQGSLLLAFFSLGLGIPFFLMALFIAQAKKFVKKIGSVLPWISLLGGLFFIVIGVLVLTDNMSLLVSYGARFFSFFQYNSLMKYL